MLEFFDSTDKLTLTKMKVFYCNSFKVYQFDDCIVRLMAEGNVDFETASKKLNHSFSMYLFSIPEKHQKTVRFSDVFKGQRNGSLGTNVLRVVSCELH